MSSDDWRSRLKELMADFGQRQGEAKARANAEGSKFDRTASAKAWQVELVNNGLAAPGWPKSVGGLELSLEDQLDYYRMTSAAGMPAHPCQTAFIVAPVLIKVGTDQQRITQETLKLLNDEAHYASMAQARNPYGDGLAAKRIVAQLRKFLGLAYDEIAPFAG